MDFTHVMSEDFGIEKNKF